MSSLLIWTNSKYIITEYSMLLQYCNFFCIHMNKHQWHTHTHTAAAANVTCFWRKAYIFRQTLYVHNTKQETTYQTNVLFNTRSSSSSHRRKPNYLYNCTHRICNCLVTPQRKNSKKSDRRQRRTSICLVSYEEPRPSLQVRAYALGLFQLGSGGGHNSYVTGTVCSIIERGLKHIHTMNFMYGVRIYTHFLTVTLRVI